MLFLQGHNLDVVGVACQMAVTIACRLVQGLKPPLAHDGGCEKSAGRQV